jgi:U3 small nucleolar ribonucleoprotein component
MKTEFDKFDTVMKKVLSVSRDELQKREKEWKRKRAKKKRAKASSASRHSSGANG